MNLNTINQQNEMSLREPVIGKTERSFHDLPPVLRNEPKDVLQQLNANISLLEDRCGRLNFLLSEVRSAIRR